MKKMTVDKKQAQRDLFSLRTRVWTHACKRSLRLKSGKDKITNYQLAQAANKKEGEGKTQATRWGQWAQGAPANLTTVTKIDRSPDLSGAAKSFLVGPWSPIFKGEASGSHVPLWKAIEQKPGELLPAWRHVPTWIWRHWCPWEGYSSDNDPSLNPIFDQCTYPKTDYLHPQFEWQTDTIREEMELNEKLNLAYDNALRRFVEGNLYLEECGTGSTLVGEIIRIEDRYNLTRTQLGLSPLKIDARRATLTKVESLLQVQRAGLLNHMLENESLRLKDEAEKMLCSYEEDFDVYKSRWVPPLRTDVELSFFLNQCLHYPTHTPPLLQLTAAISLLKLMGGYPRAIDGVTYPYPIRFTDNPGDRDIDVSVWNPLLSDLEAAGMTIDLLNQAAKGFGIHIYKWDSADEMAWQMQQEEEMKADWDVLFSRPGKQKS